MKFEERKLEDCIGWRLAHSVKGRDHKLAKASLVTADVINQLTETGIDVLQVFTLDPGDLDEDEAAEKAARLIIGEGLTVQNAGRGRANVIADCDGVFNPGSAIDQLNLLDDAFSAASRNPYSKVSKGDLVSTIKIVPYGIEKAILDQFAPNALMKVSKFSAFTVSLLVGGVKLQSKTHKTIETRLNTLGGRLSDIIHLRHAVDDYADAIKANPNDLILMLGVSAISDIRDVLPEAVRKAGGTVVKVGLPTDPGNLLMYARLGTQTIIGLPGCARSPALNGFDWVLERFAAGLPLDAQILSGFGTGGLLKEPADRSFPRRKTQTEFSTTVPSVSAIILAAGRSSRSHGAHKLLSLVDDKSVIAHSADAITKAGISSAITITGEAHEEIESILARSGTKLVHNDKFSDGMGSSIAVGIKQIEQTCEFALIYLGDMPFVQPSSIEALISASLSASPSAILMPTFNGKRGHPVLWGKQHFRALSQLALDVGGRDIIRDNAERVIEVPVNDPGILIDLDTPEMLKQFGVKPIAR